MQSYGLNRANFLKEKSLAFGGAYYVLVSLAIILVASPLFRVLGFEYSGIIAIFASIHLLYYSASKTFQIKGIGLLPIARTLVPPVFLLSSIPLVISIISALFIPNCSLWDGIIFYIEIVYLTALIAMLSGIYFAKVAKSKRAMNISLAIFWIVTLIISLLPGYFSGRIYSYGWQYGYFPGFVWDEAMELSGKYWESRGIELAFFLLLTWLKFPRKKESQNPFYPWLKTSIVIAAIILLSKIIANPFSDRDIEKFLPAKTSIYETNIHYKPESLTDDEIRLIEYNVATDRYQIDSMYGLRKYQFDTVYRKHIPYEIDVYIFPSSDDLYEYVGTREASISKPWRHAIYIAKTNLHSLRHELAHILLAPYGSFPFDISWSTGLTEGAAVAIEDDYDGIESADYFSAKMLQMNLAKGVAQVMQPSGFLSSAPSQSYVLSGSFTKYLLECCGAEKFLAVYNDRDFKEHYGQEVSALESGWKNWLKKYQTPMDHYDSLRILFYFKRTSIMQDPCLRRTGKLLKNADASFKEKDYRLADSLYIIAERESGRLKAVRGRVLSQLFLNNPSGALAILDTTRSAQETNNLSALRLLRGDVIAMSTGDLHKASAEWSEAMRLELGESYFLASFVRTFFLGRMNDISTVKRILRDLYGLEETKDKYALVFGSDTTLHEMEFYKARLFLYVSYIERTGKLKEAYRTWINESHKFPMDYRDVIFSSEVLFDKLMEKKYSHYDEVFNLVKEK